MFTKMSLWTKAIVEAEMIFEYTVERYKKILNWGFSYIGYLAYPLSVYSFLFLFHGELHLGHLILYGTSCFYREATPTATSSIDLLACEYPFLSSPCYHRSLKEWEIYFHERYREVILIYGMIHRGIMSFFHFDLMSCTPCISEDYSDRFYMSFFPGCESFRIKSYHNIKNKEVCAMIYFSLSIFSIWGRYFHMLSVWVTSHPSCSRVEGIVSRSHAFTRSRASVISGLFSPTSAMYPR